MYNADVLIDTYPCRKDEVKVLGLALAFFRDFSIGKMDELRPMVERLLGQELEPERLDRINDLLQQLNHEIWKDRIPWTPYDVSRASFHGFLAHGLENRLQRNEEEVSYCRQHLRRVLKYFP